MNKLFLIVLCSTFTLSLNAQHSLFDKAVRLDSLYDRILTGETALANAVFAELRDLYPSGEDLTDAVIYQDVSGDNYYLAKKMNYVYDLLEGQQADEQESTLALEEERYALLEEAIETAAGYCDNEDFTDPAACSFAEALVDLRLFAKAENLIALRKALGPEYAELENKLRHLEVALFDIDVRLDKLKKQADAALRLNAATGPGEFLTTTGAVAEQGFAPVIVPTGGASLQSSVIDGASRWIAERMREELSIAFFDRFEIWLEEQRMHTLFPHTVKALDISATADYSLMMQVLRTAFARDLEALPFNMGTFLRHEFDNRERILDMEAEVDATYREWRKAEAQYNNIFNGPDDPLIAARERADSLGGLLYDRNRRLTATNQEFNFVLLSIAALQELSQGRHVADLLGVLNRRSEELFPHGGKIRPALMIMDVLSRSFIRVDPERGTTWLRRAELNRLTRDQQLRDFYFGLIFHELRQEVRRRRAGLLRQRAALVGNIPYYGDAAGRLNDAGTTPKVIGLLEVEAVLRLERQLHQLDQETAFIDKVVLAEKRWLTTTTGEPWIGSLLNGLSLFTERMDNLQRQYQELRATDQAALGNPQLIQLIRNSLDVLRPVLEVALPEQSGKIDTIQQLSAGILDAYTGVLERDFDAVVLSVVPVAETLLDVDFAATLQRGELPPAALAGFTDRHGARKRKLKEIFRYGAFLAAVAESRNPEDIKQAIRAIALPPGSYSIKRRTFSNISLNVFPGLTGGAELVRNELGRKWAPNVGFTAPVGLAFSWGYRGNINNARYLNSPKYRRRVDRSLDLRDDRFLTGHSGSLYFPLIDLGAVVLFRLDDADSALPEDVGFQQIFSPGVMYSHGFANLPLSVLAGVQISPQLRRFGEAPADAIRFNFGLTVDLPMANFHTRSVEKER